jgi:hypothetical protein
MQESDGENTGVSIDTSRKALLGNQSTYLSLKDSSPLVKMVDADGVRLTVGSDGCALERASSSRKRG